LFIQSGPFKLRQARPRVSVRSTHGGAWFLAELACSSKC